MRLFRNLALSIPQIRRLHLDRDKLAAELRHLLSQPSPQIDSPFYHYNASFDPQAVIHRHAVRALKPDPRYLTNFIGVLIDPKFLPKILNGRAGELEGVPIPANWHADIAEWGAALRAVDLARETFTVVELGCGWGCWMNNTGVAARRAGLKVRLVGVEADEGHLGFAQEACFANGFTVEEFSLVRGLAASNEGTALFPRQTQPGIVWGSEPIFAAPERRSGALRTGAYDEIRMIPIHDVVPHDRTDLLHIDIQGGEADLVASSLAQLRDRVAYLVIGTHSRSIEGRLMDMLLEEDWILEIERPAILSLDDGSPRILVDGVQGWRNPYLLPN